MGDGDRLGEMDIPPLIPPSSMGVGLRLPIIIIATVGVLEVKELTLSLGDDEIRRLVVLPLCCCLGGVMGGSISKDKGRSSAEEVIIIPILRVGVIIGWGEDDMSTTTLLPLLQ